jgi:hypothetical protein
MESNVFTHDQFQQIYPDGIENHYWNHARNAIILSFITKYGLLHEPILEIGGGRGVVVKYLHEKGVSIMGVEQAAVEPVKGTGEYFYPGVDAFDLAVELKSSFTVVMLLDVIEHISDPVPFVESILSEFPNLRHIVVTVPARQELWTNYDEYNGHYKRYNLDDLKNLATRRLVYSGVGYFNHVLYPVFWLYARLIKERETMLKAPHGWQIPVHRVLSWILQTDYSLLPGRWKGTSAIGIYSIAPSFR